MAARPGAATAARPSSRRAGRQRGRVAATGRPSCPRAPAGPVGFFQAAQEPEQVPLARVLAGRRPRWSRRRGRAGSPRPPAVVSPVVKNPSGRPPASRHASPAARPARQPAGVGGLPVGELEQLGMALRDVQHPARELAAPRPAVRSRPPVPSIRARRWGSSRASSSASSADSASTASTRTRPSSPAGTRRLVSTTRPSPACAGQRADHQRPTGHRATARRSVSSDSMLSTTISTRCRSSNSVSRGRNAASRLVVEQVHHLEAGQARAPGPARSRSARRRCRGPHRVPCTRPAGRRRAPGCRPAPARTRSSRRPASRAAAPPAAPLRGGQRGAGPRHHRRSGPTNRSGCGGNPASFSRPVSYVTGPVPLAAPSSVRLDRPRAEQRRGRRRQRRAAQRRRVGHHLRAA